MNYIIEAITRRDNLTLLRVCVPEKGEVIHPAGEVCLWYGSECVAAVRGEDKKEAMDAFAGHKVTEEPGYSRFLIDGIGLHSLAPWLEELFEPYGVAAVSVSDIRVAVLLPTEQADSAWLTMWASLGKEIWDHADAVQ